MKESDIIIDKGTNERVDSYSGFGTPPEDTGLEAKLKDLGITTIYVVGLGFDYCSGSTAFDGASKGFKTILLVDLTRALADDTTKIMESRLASVGVEIKKSTEL
jgi:nicotinamidase/pyrazinamidase